MNIKLFSVGAALAVLSGPAFALTTDLGALSSGYSNAFGGGTVYAPDTFTFTLASNAMLELSATVANTTVQLESSNLALSGPTSLSSAFIKTNSWNADIGGAFPGVELQAGSYSFTITPAVISGNTGAVGYSININGVPEISTWAMMLAGFAAVAFVGYRRKNLASVAA